eukprot:CAMPEP_0113458298 /NCGR_PEP_ID=MMETSP0014_2-20120614/9852_1 /TAXON_ID=2857 /ORGANISM="Nitzschia sp." /LENGTH=403 /DNA_ID=CAMNT_0000349821 /DNA_START=148 /DNA_END=1359 /DNA_ORIENTATION=- /assembly_acc=CAM_ASM_000159
MSSWFDTGLSTLTSLTEKASETVQNASKAVKEVIPKEQQELLAKLTLNTDEMKATRQQFGEEAQRKLEAKKRLGQLLPWETSDPDREILVDECKEAILELSKNIDTFYGPYEIPMLNVHLEDDDDDDDDDDEEEDQEGGGEDGDIEGEGGEEIAGDVSEMKTEIEDTGDDEDDDGEKPVRSAASQHFRPSTESKEKLEKLQPLPPLLEDFDLDSHVGLIQRLLKEDPELVQKQAALSGGGDRERVFWQNYFFHCAFTRYEAGLSIDEIWSYQKLDSDADGDDNDGVGGADANSNVTGAAAGVTTGVGGRTQEEESVVFDGSDAVPGNNPTEPVFHNDDVVDPSSTAAAGVSGGTSESTNQSPDGAQSSNGFELVNDEDGDDGVVGDPELDELEAEIARELEGM